MTTTAHYFTKLSPIPGAGSYGTGPTPEAAIKNCVTALKQDFGRLFDLKSVRPTVTIYKITAGRYAFWDDRGVFEVDQATDLIEAYAEIDRVMERLNLSDLTDYEPKDATHGYMGGADGLAKLRQMNADRVAPIGERAPV